MSVDFLSDLEARGLVHQTSAPELAQHLARGPVTAYVGFDPTADSLHVGSLLQLVTLRRFQQAGHKPIALVGGGTGMIGDPSFKTAERSLMTLEQIEHNVAGIRGQMEKLLDFESGAVLVDNGAWLRSLQLLPFLRDIGKHFSVNQMITRDSVRTRLETREQGLSYTEFTYMLLQAYDFLELFRRHQCTLQMGGSDQWGNIVSGVDLVRRFEGAEAYGLTIPLVTKSDGSKFGKSETGNVWLDPQRTSPYAFYQFWLNVEDADVVKYLKYFTDVPLLEVDELEQRVRSAPQAREAQRRLAAELTTLVHDGAALERAQRLTQVLFDKHADYRGLTAQELGEAFSDAPSTTLAGAALGAEAASLTAVLAETQLYPSRGRARKDIPQGAVAVNNVAVRDAERVLTRDDVLPGGYIVLRKGKKNYHVLRVTDDA